MKTLLIVNPMAGRQSVSDALDGLEEMFSRNGEVRLAFTENADDARRAVINAAGEGVGLIVCCGGDGTLNGTAATLMENNIDIPLGYIPAGTTNDFASSLNIPKEPLKAAERILKSEPKFIDAGVFNGRHFMYVASFGAFTQTAYKTDRELKKNLGHLAYVLEGIKELHEIKPYRLIAEVDGKEIIDGEFIFGAVSNSTSFGGVVKLNPDDVGLDDGMLELMLIRSPKSLAALTEALRELSGGSFNPESIVFTHARSVKLSCEEPIDWTLDGEYEPGVCKAEISVLHPGIRLCC